MKVIIVGLNHKTAPVEIRERVSFSPNTIKESIQRLCQLPAIREGAILSTCNRVEIIGVTKDVDHAVRQLKRFLSESNGVSVEDIDDHLYIHTCEDAIRHLFRVASSIDSMVIGEAQILGQVKDAYAVAAECKGTGLILNRLFHKAFSVAKRVRTETNIGSSAVSVSYAAVEMAKKIFGELNGKAAMLVGAGEMGELAAKHLMSNGVSRLLIANRTYERAVKMAREFEATPVMFREFPHYLREVDIVIASTGAADYIIKPEMVTEILKERKNRPIFFIDIAVPRNIDPEVNDIENTYLFDIDDLEGVVEANLKEREKEVRFAEEIVAEELVQFCKWLNTLDIVPTIRSLRQYFEDIRKRELEKALSTLKGIDDKEKKVLDAMTSAIINKILHKPLTLLKKEGDTIEGDMYVETIRKMFDLQDVAEDSGEEKDRGEEQDVSEAAR